MYINENPVNLLTAAKAADGVRHFHSGVCPAQQTHLVDFSKCPCSCDRSLILDKRYVPVNGEYSLIAVFMQTPERTWITTSRTCVLLQVTQSLPHIVLSFFSIGTRSPNILMIVQTIGPFLSTWNMEPDLSLQVKQNRRRSSHFINLRRLP